MATWQLLTKPGGGFKHKTSSTLNKSADYAGKNMFDNDSNTCWNSDQGSPQFVLIDFGRLVVVKQIGMTFQGGFVGQEGVVESGISLGRLCHIATLDNIIDSNEHQIFEINCSEEPVQVLKLTFNSSSDFYGRMIVYKLDVLGLEI